ncbi:hypothetical protein HELRODRAFT_79233, partial [Helobdella robusta]|uniref:N-acetylgalactosaminide beta-1,3-galactosyltransferase n=1 Tax=Helobdella robusta TaxID=6412 RepID=T1G3L7_HELRO
QNIRILCWFMTDPQILNKSIRVRDTWTRNCHITLFMSSVSDPNFPSVGLNVTPGRNHIAAKSRASWIHIYRHYRDKADYFMKADPDSYVSIPNLKLFLASRDPGNPEFYGHALYYGRMGWMGNFSGFYSAGQSVVLTRESLVRLAGGVGGVNEKFFFDGQAEDLKTAICLSNKGSDIIDTRDRLGRETFMPAIGLSSLLAGNIPQWYSGPYRQYLGYCKVFISAVMTTTTTIIIIII